MTEHIVTTEEEFNLAMLDSQRELVLFTAPAWCIPCRRFEPHWEKAKDELDITMIKVDMGANPDDTLKHWATEMFGVRGVPSIKLIDGDLNVINIKSRTVVSLVKEVDLYVG